MKRYDNSELWDGHSDQLRVMLPTSSMVHQNLDAMAVTSPFDQQLVDIMEQSTLDWESEPSCSRLASCLNMNQTAPADPVHEQVGSCYDQATDSTLSLSSISRCGSWKSLVDMPWTPANQDTENTCEVRLGCGSDKCNEKDVDEEDFTVDKKPEKHHRSLRTRSLMEKERRNKINKRIEALHGLIPNARKRDKASMLHEVVEYIRSLQLLLQTMSMKMILQSTSLAPMAISAQQHFPQYQHIPPLLEQERHGMSSVLFPQLAQPSASSAPPPPWTSNFSYFPRVHAPANLYWRLLNPSQYQYPEMPIQFTRQFNTNTSVQIDKESSINDDKGKGEV